MSAVDKLKTTPLSNNTVQRQIQKMSVDTQQQTTAHVQAKDNSNALQMDESMDIANCANLLVYVKHVWEDDF